MVIRLEQILTRIRGIDREIAELNRARARVPGSKPYSNDLRLSFDRHINALLNEKIKLEELTIEDPPEELAADIISVDMATASRIRVARVRPPEEKTAAEKNLMDFFRAIPKTEIHLHMEACISKETLAGMLDKNNTPYEHAQLEKLYKFSNLQEFIQLFLFILDSIVSPDDFTLIFRNLRSYLENNNIRYAEVFLAPSRLIQNGLDFNEVARTIDSLAKECLRDGGPEVKYLIDVSRTFGPENASKNLQRVLQAKCDSIIGIGLGGAELMGPARDFKDVFAQARAEGLRAVAHSGEDDGPWSVRDTVEILKAERVGHGTSAIQDPELIELLKEKQIPIEICLTSNIFTGKYVREERNHPARRYYDEGLVCTINTDDPEIFNVDLTDEYFKFYKHMDFTVSELIDLDRQGVMSSFHPNPGELWRSFQGEIEKLRTKYKV